VTAGNPGVATCITSTLPIGTDVITATYSGDSNHGGNTGTLSGGQVVSKASASAAVSSSIDPSIYGQAVSFTVKVSPVAPATGTPTGTVQFQVDGSNFGSAVTLSAGSATSGSTSTLTIATHTVTATYSGDANFSGLVGTLTGGQVVNKTGTTTTVTTNSNPLTCGQKISFVAKVADIAPGTGTPTGTVQFQIDGANFGSPVTLSAGSATSGSNTTLTPGVHTITAIYSGDSSHSGSTGTLSGGLVVKQAPAITSANTATFTVGTASSFTVTTTGYPVPSITESGSLPSGVSFVDNHNGTGTLSGTPAAAGTFKVSFTAANGFGASAVQSFTLTASGPIASVTPGGISFGTVYLYNHGTNTNVTLKNTGNATLNISNISLSLGAGTNAGNFNLLNYCPSSLLAGQSCVLAVSFYAGNVGSLSGTITVTDNAPGSPQQVGLTATVINPLISLKPSSLSFGTIKVNSHSTAQTVTLTNTGTTALNITSISVTGTNAHDFAETNACASSLAPSAFCTISVTFTPLARGSRFANLTIVDNVQGGTQNVSLSGTGD
jgi:hypothetical protein